jgi:hypothetical protein
VANQVCIGWSFLADLCRAESGRGVACDGADCREDQRAAIQQEMRKWKKKRAACSVLTAGVYKTLQTLYYVKNRRLKISLNCNPSEAYTVPSSHIKATCNCSHSSTTDTKI